MFAAYYTDYKSEEGVDFLTFCSNDLDERVTCFGFFMSCSHREFIVAICEFKELDDLYVVGWG